MSPAAGVNSPVPYSRATYLMTTGPWTVDRVVDQGAGVEVAVAGVQRGTRVVHRHHEIAGDVRPRVPHVGLGRPAEFALRRGDHGERGEDVPVVLDRLPADQRGDPVL